jgi:hypothetical protein
MGEVAAVAGVEPYPHPLLARDDPKAVVLDLVPSQPAGRRDLDLVGRQSGTKPGNVLNTGGGS